MKSQNDFLQKQGAYLKQFIVLRKNKEIALPSRISKVYGAQSSMLNKSIRHKEAKDQANKSQSPPKKQKSELVIKQLVDLPAISN